MADEDFQKLVDDTLDALRRHQLPAAVIGDGITCKRLLARVNEAGLLDLLDTVYGRRDADHSLPSDPIAALADGDYRTLIVATDAGKEDLIEAALPYIRGAPKLIVSGYEHYDFADPGFHAILQGLEIPSLANGYPNTLPHIYQCLVNAARWNLEGVVAEFGIYRGGTTMFMARTIKQLGMTWRIYGFDTFAGFPPRRDARDMYDHEDLYDNDEAAVRAYLQDELVTIVKGDIVETAATLGGKPIVLAFIDTDNYSPAKAALEAIQNDVVVGGAIVFDHYTGSNRFRYTLGERMAAHALLEDSRYFQLHGTGVFFRQR